MTINVIKKSKSGTFGTVNVSKCARCGLDHHGLDMMNFTNPPEMVAHYAICPETVEPILITILES